VGQSTLYALVDLVLELQSEEPRREDLDCLLQELSWVRTQASTCKPALYLSVSRRKGGFRIPQDTREVLRADGFSGLEVGDDFYLTDGSSLFHLRPARGEGYARLAASFFDKSILAQANFWCFGLLKLLRPLGVYSLHAGGLATRDGVGLLLVGPPGSGKSTLTIGLIRDGWRYLSDDALLLRLGPQGVKALACRRSFYIDSVRSPTYCDLSLGDEEPDTQGGQRRRVGIEKAYPEQYLSQCIPRIMVFPRITHENQSTLMPVDGVRALGVLLVQSAPQLFDRSTMPQHLELLKRLLQQTVTYQLNAGTDLYRAPAKLIGLIQEAQGERIWRGLSLS
jgi:hypothetical protein